MASDIARSARASTPFVVAGGALMLFLVHVWRGIAFPGFGDESEHLLGGRLINAGGRLYATYLARDHGHADHASSLQRAPS